MPDTRRGETIDQLTRRADAAIDNLRKLRADIPHLWRIGQHDATGPEPASLRPSDGPGGTSEDTPTERAALNEHNPADLIGAHIAAMFATLADIDTLAHRNEGRRQVIHRAASKHLGRIDTTGTCEICDRTVPGTPQDRLRSGMCQADYAAWRRYCDTTNEPSREQFARQRRDETRQAS